MKTPEAVRVQTFWKNGARRIALFFFFFLLILIILMVSLILFRKPIATSFIRHYFKGQGLEASLEIRTLTLHEIALSRFRLKKAEQKLIEISDLSASYTLGSLLKRKINRLQVGESFLHFIWNDGRIQIKGWPTQTKQKMEKETFSILDLPEDILIEGAHILFSSPYGDINLRASGEVTNLEKVNLQVSLLPFSFHRASLSLQGDGYLKLHWQKKVQSEKGKLTYELALKTEDLTYRGVRAKQVEFLQTFKGDIPLFLKNLRKNLSGKGQVQIKLQEVAFSPDFRQRGYETLSQDVIQNFLKRGEADSSEEGSFDYGAYIEPLLTYFLGTPVSEGGAHLEYTIHQDRIQFRPFVQSFPDVSLPQGSLKNLPVFTSFSDGGHLSFEGSKDTVMVMFDLQRHEIMSNGIFAITTPPLQIDFRNIVYHGKWKVGQSLKASPISHMLALTGKLALKGKKEASLFLEADRLTFDTTRKQYKIGLHKGKVLLTGPLPQGYVKNAVLQTSIDMVLNPQMKFTAFMLGSSGSIKFKELNWQEKTLSNFSIGLKSLSEDSPFISWGSSGIDLGFIVEKLQFSSYAVGMKLDQASFEGQTQIHLNKDQIQFSSMKKATLLVETIKTDTLDVRKAKVNLGEGRNASINLKTRFSTLKLPIENLFIKKVSFLKKKNGDLGKPDLMLTNIKTGLSTINFVSNKIRKGKISIGSPAFLFVRDEIEGKLYAKNIRSDFSYITGKKRWDMNFKVQQGSLQEKTTEMDIQDISIAGMVRYPDPLYKESRNTQSKGLQPTFRAEREAAFNIERVSFNKLHYTAEIASRAELPLFAPVRFSGIGTFHTGKLELTYDLFSSVKGVLLSKGRFEHFIGLDSGSIEVTGETLNFTPNEFQPTDLFPVLKGKLVDTEGVLKVQLNLGWRKGELQSSGLISLQNLTMKLALGKIMGLSSEVKLSSLWPLTSQGNQNTKITFLDFILPMRDGKILWSVQENNFKVLQALWPFAGGEIGLEPFEYSIGDDLIPLEAYFRSIDLSEVLALIKRDDLKLSGHITGRLPLQVHKDRVTIKDGHFLSLEPGILQYKGQAGGAKGGQAQTVFDLLQNFHYDAMEGKLDGDLNKKMMANIYLKGKNPDVFYGADVNFNINLEANFLQLLQGINAGSNIKTNLEKALKGFP